MTVLCVVSVIAFHCPLFSVITLRSIPVFVSVIALRSIPAFVLMVFIINSYDVFSPVSFSAVGRTAAGDCRVDPTH